eukprot:13258027-Alexandrium_andersonii.AAC.1
MNGSCFEEAWSKRGHKIGCLPPFPRTFQSSQRWMPEASCPKPLRAVLPGTALAGVGGGDFAMG